MTADPPVTRAQDIARRKVRHEANLARIPRDIWQGRESLYGRTRYQVRMDPALLADLTDEDLVDYCDGGPGAHFGGHVDRQPEAGTATVTVYID